MRTVWTSKLDDKYDVFVESESDPYKGFLVIKDGDKELFREETTISFGGPFGPDMDDVDRWQTKACEVIDLL